MCLKSTQIAFDCFKLLLSACFLKGQNEHLALTRSGFEALCRMLFLCIFCAPVLGTVLLLNCLFFKQYRAITVRWTLDAFLVIFFTIRTQNLSKYFL